MQRQHHATITDASIAAGLARVREDITAACRHASRAPDDVHILAAIKYLDADGCARLIQAGLLDLAENRIEQLVDKQDAAASNASVAPSEPIRWHYIGRLQSRQAPRIAERASMIHTLCTASAAARLARSDARPELLVQVNVDADPDKDGLAPADVERFLTELPAELTVSGFMTMPAFAADPQQSRPAFDALRRLRDELAPRLAGRHDLRALSMGTSQDFAVAVEEGATHVRLGRILFNDGE